MSDYLAVASDAQAEVRIKGSRFLGLVVPATTETAAGVELERVRAEYPDATHHCWAWRVGHPPRGRSSDDGEPRGTAGPPILRVLEGTGLSDAVAVVVRWYGGTKLGKGGLARAYSEATKLAVGKVETVRRFVRRRVTLAGPYSAHGAVQRLVNPPDVEIVGETYGESVTVELAVVEGRLEHVENLAAALGLEIEVAADSVVD